MNKLLGVILLLCAVFPPGSSASTYNARPKLVVIIIIDQFRGDYLERYHDEFGANGFRLFTDRGAYFTDCYFDYANTYTAPGHATLLTGAYSDGHGIFANEWWDAARKRQVTSVEDDATRLLGGTAGATGASPHNLMASTLGDELKLATQGKTRVFGIALKDRAAVLPAGWSGDGAFWIDTKTGAWVSSTYYGEQLPEWVRQFNQSKAADKYWNQEWTDASGTVLGNTARTPGAAFYDVVGQTPLANDYEFEFARELITNEKLGSGPATDLLIISLSANDILGHRVGPDAPQMHAMAMAMDRQIAEFASFLGGHLGLANVWMALSADHGVAPVPAQARTLRVPATVLDDGKLRTQVNQALAARMGPHDFVRAADFGLFFLAPEAFGNVSEATAEQATGTALVAAGMRAFFTKSQLAQGNAPATALGRKYLHSASPYGGWWVTAVPPAFAITGARGTTHGAPYSYDTHVPLAFYGTAFRPGTYRGHSEPVDLAPTLASLLGVNAPSSSIGRVLTEALASAPQEENSGGTQ